MTLLAKQKATSPANGGALLHDIADQAVGAVDSGRQVSSFSARYPSFTIDDAYRVTARANGLRIAQGYIPVGRKIGFTNSRLWDEYGVRAPNWGYIYDRTLHDLVFPLRLAGFAEPKLEPEIMFGLGKAPSPGMDDAALLSCVAWVAHGFEIVHSIYPGWKFTSADSVAANAMHGALLIGPRHEIGTNQGEWLRALTSFEIELFCDGRLMDKGKALNVLEGPLSTIRYVMDLLAHDSDNPRLVAGEIISTGTLTRALPVKSGESWTTRLKGIALEDAGIRFC